MQYHRNARTNVNQRQAIKTSSESTRVLGKTYKISNVTAAKWKNANHTEDKSHRPETIHYAVPKEFWELIRKTRESAKLALDDLLSQLIDYVPNLNHSNCYRILKFYHLNRLSEKDKREIKKFASYPPGYLHIDCFYLPKMNGVRYYAYLAVDRATRLIFIRIYRKKDKYAAADFLTQALAFYPFRIHHVLTDNGKEFTVRGQKAFGNTGKKMSLFEMICDIADIDYRKTKVKHPWTNGMAERMVRTTKDHTIKIETYDNSEAMVISVLHFQGTHNFKRRLQALKFLTPFQATVEWFGKEPKLFIKHPNELLTIR